MTQCAGLGLATSNSKGEVIEVFYPQPELNPDPALLNKLAEAAGIAAGENGM